MPPAPVGQPPPPPLSVGVVLPQAARKPERLESESAVPPDRRRKSRRVVAKRRSFGCIKPSLLNRLAIRASVEGHGYDPNESRRRLSIPARPAPHLHPL